MPGVPSSRGCDNCRKQKKKCLAAFPPCQRCSRLQLRCIGLGQQRFKFVAQRQKSVVLKKTTVVTPSYGPHNDRTRLTSALIDVLDPTLSIEVNLPYNLGGFLVGIPRRLGHNEALDAASDALVMAWVHFRSGERKPSLQVLRKHGLALNALRRYLEEPAKAQATETLCAVQTIMITQTFLGQSFIISHSVGAAQILRSRGYTGPRNNFEEMILLAQRGSLVVEALMNDKIQLTPREWSDLVESKLDNQSLDGQMIRILARVPGLMERARKAISMENADSSSQSKLRKECQALGGQLQPIMATARSHLDKNDLSLLSNHVDPPQNTYFVHALRSRSYGFALMVNAILQRISHCLGEDVPDYSDQSRHLAQDIITLAVIARRYRPLGSMYMITCLTAAYVVTDDLTIQNASAALIQQYRTDLSGPNTKSWTSSELDWLRQRFMLRESCTYDEAFHTYV